MPEKDCALCVLLRRYSFNIYFEGCLQSVTSLSGNANGANITSSKQILLLPHFVYPDVLLGGICKKTQINS